MNSVDVLKYGHLTVLKTLENFPESEWYTTGACGYWSVKDLIAHLASFEQILAEVLNNLIEPGSTPYLDLFASQGINFNDNQVNQRGELSMQDVLDEYKAAYERVRGAAVRIPQGLWRQNGLLPWYGEEYDLEDFVVYTFYAHKREHCGQIAVFSDRFK